jgi:hypothetical protein
MPLEDFDLPTDVAAVPHDAGSFLREAGRRIERFQRRGRVPAFVPSDYVRVYDVLRALAAGAYAPGDRFCEWGSGFGVVVGLAALLGFDAVGIEVESELVLAARELADDFGLPVEFVHGTFIPAGGEACAEAGGAFAWLTAHAGGAYEELGLDPDDFDVVYAYPWPDEEDLIEALFERYVGVGAVLVTFHGGDDIRLRRKTS